MKNLIFIVLSITALIIPLEWPFETRGEECSVNQGEITSIDLDNRTCVVEVPLGGRFCTVAGVISHDTVLKKGGFKAGLEDFSVGDIVIFFAVGDKNGFHLILMNCLSTPASSSVKISNLS